MPVRAVPVRAAFLLAALAGLVGCGPNPTVTRPAPVVETPVEPPAGALVVRNGTVDALEIRLDGEVVAELRPGQTWRGDDVAAGRHEVVAVNDAVGVVHARGIDVPADYESRWLIRQRYGVLVVTNDAPKTASIVVAGERIGAVPAGRERRFSAVPAGRRRVQAIGPGERVFREDVLAIEEGVAVPWRVGAPERSYAPRPAALRVANTTDLTLQIHRDGLPLGPVAPRTSAVFRPLEPGSARLAARDGRGDVLATASVVLAPGAEATWRVALASCRLRVENRAETRYLVTVDGAHVGPVGPRRAHVYAGIQPGTHRLEALPVEGGVSRRREIVCPPGGSVEWVLTPPPRAAIEVRNTTDAPVTVSMDGRRLGVVRSGYASRFRNLAPGTHRLEATAKGAPPHVRDITLEPGEVAGWSIGPRPAALVVRNGWEMPAIVVLDGRRIGRVPPRSTGRFEDLVAGAHVVRAERAGGAPQVADLRLPEGRTTEWAIRPDAPATLRVVNRNALPVALSIAGRDRGTLAPGGERVFAGLRPGAVQVEARAPTGARDIDQLQLAPGAVVVWMARLPDHAALRVVNHARTDVVVDLRGRRLGVVRAGSDRTFPDLPPGRHHVRAVRPSGAPVVAERDVSLTTGAMTAWVVRDVPGARLRVHNGSRERVIVFLGRTRLGPVPAGGEVVFDELQPGNAVVVARSLAGHELARETVTLRARGPAAQWTVRTAPATGELVVENHMGVPIKVLLGRTHILGELPVGGRRVFEVPRGVQELRAYDTAARPAILDTEKVRIGARPVTWHVRKPRKRLPRR